MNCNNREKPLGDVHTTQHCELCGSFSKASVYADVVPSPCPVLTNPAAFDLFLNSGDAITNELHGQGDLVKIRRTQVALAYYPDQLAQHLHHLSNVTEAPAPGVRTLMKVALGDYLGALMELPAKPDASELGLENLCHDQTARAMAHAQLGQFDEAATHLHAAIVLTQALQLSNREQMLRIEQERVRTLRGQPHPLEIERQLMSVMPARRRAWGRRTLAEALAAQGAYTRALHALGAPQGDTPRDLGMRAYLHALLGLPALTGGKSAYALVAAALEALPKSPHSEALASIHDEPEASCARTVEAMGALRAGLPQLAVQILAGQVGHTSEQRVYLHLLRLRAYLEGAHVDGHAAFGGLAAAFGELGQTDEVARVIRRYNPTLFILLSYSPVAQHMHSTGINGVALLRGATFSRYGETHRLPGRSGVTTVLEALGLPHDGLTRVDRSRMREALSSAGVQEGELVNLGTVAAYVVKMVEASRKAGSSAEAVDWRSRLSQIIEGLSNDVQIVLSRHTLC